MDLLQHLPRQFQFAAVSQFGVLAAAIEPPNRAFAQVQTPRQGEMKRPPMNAKDDMTAGLDRSMLVVIEMPIDAVEPASAFVLGSQGIIDGQINSAERITVASLEITDDELEQRQPEVVGVPGADAKEVSEVAGIDAGKFQGGQLCQGLAARRDDEKVAEAFDVLALWRR